MIHRPEGPQGLGRDPEGGLVEGVAEAPVVVLLGPAIIKIIDALAKM